MDRRIHDRTLSYVPEESRGITFMTAPGNKRALLEQRLAPFCLMKKYQVGADAWIGVGGTPDDPIAGIVVVQEPWKPNIEMERIVRQLPYKVEDGQLSEPRRRWLGRSSGSN